MPKSSTEVQRGLVDGQIMDRGPEFQGVAVAVALVTVVSPMTQVDRERPTPRRGRAVDGARSAELVAPAGGWLEAEASQHLLHRDLGTQPGEVDSRHDALAVSAGRPCPLEESGRTVPFPSFSREGTGTALRLGHSASCQPVGVRQIRPLCSND
jgi:hypothetical protein